MGDRLVTIESWAENWGAVPLLVGELGPYLTQCAWAEAYLRTKWHLDPSSRFATTDMGRNLGTVPLGGGAVSASNTMLPRPRPTIAPGGILIHPAVWPQQTWAKIGGCAPFWEGEAGSPSNTMSLGSKAKGKNVKVKVKVGFLHSATYTKPEHRALQSRKWQLTGERQWCCSAKEMQPIYYPPGA